MVVKSKKAAGPKQPVTRAKKYMEKLKKRGIDRKTLDLDTGTFEQFDAYAQRFHISSGTRLMILLLNNLAGNEKAPAIIQEILFPPK